MLRTILAVSAIAMAAPAVAQDNSATVEADAAVDAQATAPQEGDPITVRGNPEQQRLADEAVPEVVASKADVTFAIDAEWRNFDKNADDKLDEMEFAWFMKKIRETAGNIADSSEEVGRINAAAFAQADTDRSKFVTRDEMIGLLRGPAA